MTLRNVTIDDFNNSTLISYNPPQCTGFGWTINKQRGYSGTYSYCRSDDVPLSAYISFTGVAVYYVSPNFEGHTMRFKLDGVLSKDVNLSTPSGRTVNSMSTRIIWKQTELENKLHSLELQPGTNVTTLSVDAFIITQADSTNTTFTTGVTYAAAGTSTGLSTKPSGTVRLGIIFGAIFGSITFVIFIAIAIFLAKRTRALNKKYTRSIPLPPISMNDRYNTTTRASTQDSFYSSPAMDPATGESDLIMRPLPMPAHGSFTTHGDFEYGDASPRGWTPKSPVPPTSYLLRGASSSSRPFRPLPVPVPTHESFYEDDDDTTQGWTSKSPMPSRSPSSSHPFRGSSSQDQGNSAGTVSRSATLTMPKLEPLRRGTVGS